MAVAALVIAAWFPASALYQQHKQLAATDEHLAQVKSQDAALKHEANRLESSAEVARIAREQYQLVDPGQAPYEVLPPTGAAGGSYDGDPGLHQPVVPSGAAELPPGSRGSAHTGGGSSTTTGSTGGTTTGAGGSAGTGSSSGGTTSGSLLGRIAHTLEFWH